MNSELEKLSIEIWDMARDRVDIGLFKSKLNKEVLLYDSSNYSYVFHRIVWTWAHSRFDYIKAMLDILSSHGDRMRLFSLRSLVCKNQTPLEITIRHRSISTTRLLFEYGARLYIQGFDALYHSAINDREEMMMLLLRHGARFHARTIKVHRNRNVMFPIVNIIKNIEVMLSPLFVKRLRKKGSVYINKEIVRELLYFLI